MRQNDIKKIMAYQKIFIGPLVWKCSTNDFVESSFALVLLWFCNPFPGISDFLYIFYVH